MARFQFKPVPSQTGERTLALAADLKQNLQQVVAGWHLMVGQRDFGRQRLKLGALRIEQYDPVQDK